MRVMMMTGTWPPGSCGVGDYTAKLADHLEGAVEVVRYRTEESYTRLSALRVLRDVARARPDVLHIQYPAAGYLRSVLPSLLALHPGVRTAVTLHEFSIFRPYRLPWFVPFRFADALIFTNAVERAAFEARLGRRSRRTAVIPIGSNIPVGRPTGRGDRSVAHFGLLMPGKGIEQFFALAALVKPDGFDLSVIGAAPAGAEAYRAWVEGECRRLGIRLHLDRTEQEVADLLQAVRFAYLPFPDGASEKRGSLLAVLENGVTALTTRGAATPDWIAACTLDAPTPEAAAARLRAAATGSAGDGPSRYVRRGWDEIARRHQGLYAELLGRAPGTRAPAVDAPSRSEAAGAAPRP